MVRKRVVLVTGAGSGIGLATVERLLRSGHQVLAGARKEEDLARVEEMGATPVRLDVTNPEDLEAAAARAVEAGVWAVVHNAGVGFFGAAEDLAVDVWRRQFDVNFFGVVALTRRLLSHLRSVGGRVVMVTSIVGVVSLPLMGPYCASKWAVESYAHALRAEVRRSGMRVCVVGPGTVDTRFFATMRSGMDAHVGPESRFFPAYERIRRHAGEHAWSMRPQRVAAAIAACVERGRPRARRGVGFWQNFVARLGWALPPWLRDRILSKYIGR